MVAKCNQLNVIFNYHLIDEKYDFYLEFQNIKMCFMDTYTFLFK